MAQSEMSSLDVKCDHDTKLDGPRKAEFCYEHVILSSEEIRSMPTISDVSARPRGVVVKVGWCQWHRAPLTDQGNPCGH